MSDAQAYLTSWTARQEDESHPWKFNKGLQQFLLDHYLDDAMVRCAQLQTVPRSPCMPSAMSCLLPLSTRPLTGSLYFPLPLPLPSPPPLLIQFPKSQFKMFVPYAQSITGNARTRVLAAANELVRLHKAHPEWTNPPATEGDEEEETKEDEQEAQKNEKADKTKAAGPAVPAHWKTDEARSRAKKLVKALEADNDD